MTDLERRLEALSVELATTREHITALQVTLGGWAEYRAATERRIGSLETSRNWVVGLILGGVFLAILNLVLVA